MRVQRCKGSRDLTPEQMTAAKLNEAMGASMRLWMAPPGMDAEKLEWLRSTFIEVTDLKGFRRQYNRRWGVFSRLTGAESETFVKDALTKPIDEMAALTKWAQQHMAAQ